MCTDLEGRITLWNERAEELYGWTAKEVMNRRGRDFLVADQLAHRAPQSPGRSPRWRSKARRGPASSRSPPRTGTRSPIWAVDHPLRTTGPDGEVVGIVEVTEEVGLLEHRVDAGAQRARRHRRAARPSAARACNADASTSRSPSFPSMSSCRSSSPGPGRCWQPTRLASSSSTSAGMCSSREPRSGPEDLALMWRTIPSRWALGFAGRLALARAPAGQH